MEFLDTSLRDGAQSSNISYSLKDKLDIIELLDNFCVDFIEIGNPSSNPKDAELSKTKIKANVAKLCVFGSTRKKNTKVLDNDGLVQLIESNCEYICLFGKSSVFSVTEILNTSKDENLLMIKESIEFLILHGKKVIFDAEHFFEGFAVDRNYTLQCLSVAADAGARVLVLCDTNGGGLPDAVANITAQVKEHFPNIMIGIHCHNDNGLAIANTLAAIGAGAEHIQGTLLGTGERAGNACLSTLFPILSQKYALVVKMKNLYDTANAVAEISNIAIPENMPYIGANAFAHKGGMHIDGMIKNSKAFEHIDPEQVGNHRRFLISEMSGKTLVAEKLKLRYPDIDKKNPVIDKVIYAVKNREKDGYQYDVAEASFYLMADDIILDKKHVFELVNYEIKILSNEVDNCSVVINLMIKNQVKTASATGVGPVHALDLAMRKCLISCYGKVKDIHLIDYKVRVIDPKSATGAKVRVLINTVFKGEIAMTIGVSEDIIKASYLALSDAYYYHIER